MALTRGTFQKISTHVNDDAPQIWGYRTNDTAALVIAANYFDALADRLRVGDLIYVHGDADGTPFYKLYVVTARTASAVTVALSLTIL